MAAAQGWRFPSLASAPLVVQRIVGTLGYPATAVGPPGVGIWRIGARGSWWGSW